jgi:hypothetical protein
LCTPGKAAAIGIASLVPGENTLPTGDAVHVDAVSPPVASAARTRKHPETEPDHPGQILDGSQITAGQLPQGMYFGLSVINALEIVTP